MKNTPAQPAPAARKHPLPPPAPGKTPAPGISDALALQPGQSLQLLKALHILTRDGQINQDSRRKLKQVRHLVQFITPILDELCAAAATQPASLAAPTLVDHGAGKSYLGFILYDWWFRPRGAGHIYGIETRAELVEQSSALARQLGFERMHFLHMTAASAQHASGLPGQIDIVTALHACDTATDDAIAFGLAKQARAMALVPCCQAEIAACLRQNKALQLAPPAPLAQLWRHPLHTREFGSHITNVLRCLYLQSQGYSVTVTELVGWQHSLKNELILARHTGQKNRRAAQALSALLTQFGFDALRQTRFGHLDPALCT